MPITQPHITARVDSDIQSLLAKATALAGMSSIDSFVLGAAIEKAKRIVEQDQILKLSENDATMLFRKLDKPAKANVQLKKAAAFYESKV